MTSLSKFIKSSQAELSKGKIISIKMIEINKKDEKDNNDHGVPLYPIQLIEDAKLKASQLLEEARNQAEEIRQQIQIEKENWKTECEKLKEEAFKQGYQEGYSQGERTGFESVKEQIELAKSVVDTAKNDYRAKIDSAEQTILLIALKAAEKIINREIENDPSYMKNVVKKVLKEARDYREIQIIVHPSHYSFIVSQKDELLSLFPREIELYIYPDDQVTQNSCIIETEGGRIDASIDSQLEMLKQTLLEKI
jgi:flagellar assembly protein FliH